MKAIRYFILFYLFLGSCNGQSDMERKKILEEKVLKIHDEAMSKMDASYQLQMNLKKLNQKLIQKSSDTTVIHLIRNQSDLLTQAEESMMGWMHQYKLPENLSPQQTIVYLQSQLIKINRVNNQMNSALETARKTYQQYGNN